MNRSKPLTRKEPMRSTAKAKILRPRLCEGCRRVKFRPARDNVTWCSDECGADVALRRVAADEERKHRKALKDSKPLQHWLDLTEDVVNKLIRTRDADRPCISCGTWVTVQWEAGHYRNVGSHPSIRFDPRNIHKQCHRCNCEMHGNKDGYRIGLVERYGEPFMEFLEGPHPIAKFTREALAEIRKQAAAETRRIERERYASPSPDSGAYLGAYIA